MRSISNIQSLNIVTVPLKGKNLIEASAGTGKTYSLAVMAVRLIIEKGLSCSEILMVTFTEKAVAELQIRVRQFIRNAYKYSCNNEEDVDLILRQLVDNEVNANQYLAKAILELDQLNIYTIHSFCQQTLAEYAFITNEAFNKELVTDISEYQIRFIQRFLRERLYHLPSEELDDLLAVYSELLSLNEYKHLLVAAKQCTVQDFDTLIDFYTTNFLVSTNPKQSNLRERLDGLRDNEPYKFIYDMIYEMSKDVRLQESLEEANVFSFDDLIINLSKSITPKFIKELKQKYKALFIDEFQDTDALQYKIFSEAFVSQVAFYIGDPKQSIYKFRNADLNTYFKAKEEVDTIYNLPNNYRSAPSLVKVVNHLFEEDRLIAEGENAFGFSLNEKYITYEPVRAVKQESNYLTYASNVVASPFYINQIEDNSNIIAQDILAFLTYAKHNNEVIQPNQIAFIASKNDTLVQMKKSLAELQIPSVIVQDAKIFHTEEAFFVLTVLKAIQSRSIKQITQVIGHRLFNLELNVLPQIDYTTYIELFYTYYESIALKGIYEVLMRFYTDFDIENLVEQHISSHVQFWANLNQIAEQLQEIQTNSRIGLDDIIIKLSQGKLGTEDAYQMRVESDEKAVQLLTIHKSKGLEFDYIFTGNLNRGNMTNLTGFMKYFDPTNTRYNIDLSLKNIMYYNAYYQENEKQEYRRLLYVLLTRAKYGMFCYSEPKRSGGSFDSFLRGISEEVINTNFDFGSTNTKYKIVQKENTTIDDVVLNVVDKNWKKLSYSYLSGAYHPFLVENTVRDTTAYDGFIFETLDRGTATGNLVHGILEYIDFANAERWPYIIDRSIRKYAPSKVAVYKETMPAFLNHVMNATIALPDSEVKLSSIENDCRANELEFDFLIDQLKLEGIKQLRNEKVVINSIDPHTHQGIFNGLIDMVFKWEDKYYIVDWKTNQIGNQIQDYTAEKIQEAMTAHNYHLQYCVYTVALIKFLRTKIEDFDYDTHFGGVIYLFVRGMREDSNTGIYTNRLCKDDAQLLEDIFK